MNEIEILISTGMVRSDAEKHVKNGCIIFDNDDLANNAESYADEWDLDDDMRSSFIEMVNTKKPMADWDVTEYEGKTYFIQYSL